MKSLTEIIEGHEAAVEDAAKDLFNMVHSEDIDAGEDMVPIWHIVTKDNELHVVASPFEGYDDKEAVGDFIRQYCQKTKAIFIAFICEAWTVKVDNDHPSTPGLPSEHPDRQEILLIYTESELHTHGISYEIKRDSNNRATLGDREDWTGDSFTGRFTDFIEKLD